MGVRDRFDDEGNWIKGSESLVGMTLMPSQKKMEQYTDKTTHDIKMFEWQIGVFAYYLDKKGISDFYSGAKTGAEGIVANWPGIPIILSVISNFNTMAEYGSYSPEEQFYDDYKEIMLIYTEYKGLQRTTVYRKYYDIRKAIDKKYNTIIGDILRNNNRFPYLGYNMEKSIEYQMNQYGNK